MIHFTIKKVLKEKAFKIFTAFLMISFYLNLCFFCYVQWEMTNS